MVGNCPDCKGGSRGANDVAQEQEPEDNGLELRVLGIRLRLSARSLSDILKFMGPDRKIVLRLFFWGLFLWMVAHAVSLIR